MSSGPGRGGGRIFFSRVNFVCRLLFGVRSTPVLPQWHVKDSGHSVKSAGGRLHTPTPLTLRSRNGHTMLSRLSVGTVSQGNGLIRNSSGNSLTGNESNVPPKILACKEKDTTTTARLPPKVKFNIRYQVDMISECLFLLLFFFFFLSGSISICFTDSKH